MAQKADEDENKIKSISSLSDLDSYIKKDVDEDQNVILCFYDPKKEVANPMTDRLTNIMENEGIYTVTVAKCDRTKANKDIMDRYKVKCDCIIAINKSKDTYPPVKLLTNFMEMSIKKLVVGHKYKGK